MTTLPSGIRPETLPAVPDTRPLATMSWVACSTASWVGELMPDLSEIALVVVA